MKITVHLKEQLLKLHIGLVQRPLNKTKTISGFSSVVHVRYFRKITAVTAAQTTLQPKTYVATAARKVIILPVKQFSVARLRDDLLEA